jgi:hypothetical protein
MSKSTAFTVRGIAIVALCICGSAQTARDVLGTWEGESICTVRPSPCRDEHAIYEISRSKDPDHLTISMDKVVQGERQNMGSLDCRYQPGHLLCHYREDRWDFAIEGNQMKGTLILSDGRLYRRISAQKK